MIFQILTKSDTSHTISHVKLHCERRFELYKVLAESEYTETILYRKYNNTLL